MKRQRRMHECLDSDPFANGDFELEASSRGPGEITPTERVRAQIRALSDPGWRVRRNAAWALGVFGRPLAAEPLCRALRDTHAEVRRCAMEALAQIGEPAVEPLIRTLGSTYVHARRHAAEALGKIGGTRATEGLCEALHDSEREVRAQAMDALAEIGVAALPVLYARRGFLVVDVIRQIERASTRTYGLPRAAEDDAPSPERRPRAEDVPAAEGPSHPG